MLRELFSAVSFCAHQLFIASFGLLRGGLHRLNFRSLTTENYEMPQEMNILCCYSCNMYQVHIVKKSNKWQCKICGEKQSIQVVHFQGSGSDCRTQVQYLNGLKANQEIEESFHSTTIPEFGLDCQATERTDIEPCDCPSRAKRSYDKRQLHQQSDYEDIESDNDDDSLSATSVVAENFHEKKIDKYYSLPPAQNSSSGTEKTFKSRTYPLADNSQKKREKIAKYAESSQEGSSSQLNFTKTEVSTGSQSSLKNGIFDDSDDDLVDEIDF